MINCQLTSKQFDHLWGCVIFSAAISKFRNHRSSTFPTHKKGFWLQRRSPAQRSYGFFLHTTKLSHLRTGDGISKSWLPICSNHGCSHQHGRHTAGGLRAILTQKDEFDNFYDIPNASRQLKDHEKNYSPFLLESAAAVWAWTYSMSTWKGKSLSFLLTTSLWKKWAISIPRWWTDSKLHCWNTTLLFNTKKELSCQLITSPDFHPAIQTRSPKSQNVLTLSNPTFWNCKKQTKAYSIWTISGSTVNGQRICLNLKPIIWKIWLLNFNKMQTR